MYFICTQEYLIISFNIFRKQKQISSNSNQYYKNVVEFLSKKVKEAPPLLKIKNKK